MVSYKCDGSTAVIVANCNRRGWEQLDEGDENFDVYFASVSNVKYLFGSDVRLGLTQRINHFPNHFELTRKVGGQYRQINILADRCQCLFALAQEYSDFPETAVLDHT